MLTFWGHHLPLPARSAALPTSPLGGRSRFCDGISRREFLRVGTLGAGALSLTLSDLLRLQAEPPASIPGGSGRRVGTKSVIMVYLPGGPSHLDMYDPKPEAPVEYRGEFKAIDTNVPGVQICEHFPRQARIMDKLAILRAVVGARDAHDAFQFLTGYSEKDARPALGNVVSRVLGGNGSMPPYVTLNRMREEDPRYLGSAHRPFEPSGPGLENLRLVQGIDLDRLKNRRSLLATFDGLRRDLDATRTLEGMDEFTRRAFDMITSGKVRDAFDLSDEDPRVVASYGPEGQRFLQARRLVEAGVRVVTLTIGGWDTHGDNFKHLRNQLPQVDNALASLILDLHARGLADDVAVVMWGEFGRTPKVNNTAGRDHWPLVMSTLIAGGGLRMGQAIGASDGRGERAADRPVTQQNILATLYHVLGIDPGQTFLNGAGRPVYVLDDREVIKELV